MMDDVPTSSSNHNLNVCECKWVCLHCSVVFEGRMNVFMGAYALRSEFLTDVCGCEWVYLHCWVLFERWMNVSMHAYGYALRSEVLSEG